MTDQKPRFSKIELQKAWSRFLNGAYTHSDVLMIVESLKENDNFREFYEASNHAWELSGEMKQLETEAQREEYRIQAAKLLVLYEQKYPNRRMRPAQPQVKRRRQSRILYTMVMLCAVMVPLVYYTLNRKPEPEPVIQYVEATANRGEIKTVTLPDNSRVVLNANSTIRYPAVFATGERVVELQGEASFDVTRNPDQPFVVKTDVSTVRVLGTAFDVMAYREDRYATVSVISGKVMVDLTDGQAILEQNEQLKVNRNTGNFEKLTVDAGKYLLWAEGKLFFHRTPLREVVNVLNRHYPQLNLELAEGEYNNLISGEHDNKTIDAVLTSITRSTGIRSRKEYNKIILYQNKFTKP
ncbi:MAG: FecR domain-containing protein [Bacteroidales bacterium]|jgi:ferric-dicitrate binding protein FerR (iron transport regulator)|nr:FecR domain-containing protein [Bacteroidales bacterium]